MVVVVRFTWTPGEYRRMLTAQADATVSGRALGLILSFAPFGVVATLALAFVTTSIPGTELALTALPWFLLSVMWWMTGRRFYHAPLLLRSAWKRREEERTVSEAGLDVSGAIDATFVPWSEVERVVETSEFFLFFGGSRRTHAIPKRVLDVTALAQVRALAAKHVVSGGARPAAITSPGG